MSWLEPWPPWSPRWFGWAARLVIGVVGGLFGLALMVLANWGANSDLRTTDWGTEEVVFALFGVFTSLSSLWVLARPSKASVAFLSTAVVGALLAGGIL